MPSHHLIGPSGTVLCNKKPTKRWFSSERGSLNRSQRDRTLQQPKTWYHNPSIRESLNRSQRDRTLQLCLAEPLSALESNWRNRLNRSQRDRTLQRRRGTIGTLSRKRVSIGPSGTVLCNCRRSWWLSVQPIASQSVPAGPYFATF